MKKLVSGLAQKGQKPAKKPPNPFEKVVTETKSQREIEKERRKELMNNLIGE